MTDPILLDLILQPGGLRVMFQPIFAIDPQAPGLFGVECLIRGPDGTDAEHPDAMFEYVRRHRAEPVTDRACVAAILAEAGRLPSVPRVSFNVHAATLGRDVGFAAFILNRAMAARINPTRLILEIVEHAPPLDVPSFHTALDALREAEVTIALDDVGLGQSNYKMILDVRPQIYKLDRYLVTKAWNDSYRQVILDSLAKMISRLDARAVAEGVEDIQELIAVQAAGIELVQGFLLSNPLSSADLRSSGFLNGYRPPTG